MRFIRFPPGGINTRIKVGLGLNTIKVRLKEGLLETSSDVTIPRIQICRKRLIKIINPERKDILSMIWEGEGGGANFPKWDYFFTLGAVCFLEDSGINMRLKFYSVLTQNIFKN